MAVRKIGLFILFFMVTVGGFAFAEQNDMTLSGLVTDGAGVAVEGAEIYVFRGKNVKKPADFISNKTLADGLYKVVLPAGDYWVVAVYRQSGAKFGPLGLGDKHSGEPMALEVKADMQQDFEVVDLREAALKVQKRNEDLLQISGRLLDKSGTAMPMAFAMAEKSNMFKSIPRYISAWTDESGEYVLFMPPGHYFIGASLNFPPESGLALVKEITLDKDAVGVDIVVDNE